VSLKRLCSLLDIPYSPSVEDEKKPSFVEGISLEIKRQCEVLKVNLLDVLTHFDDRFDYSLSCLD